MKVYNKPEDIKCGFTTRIDAVLKGVNAKNLVMMTRDTTLRRKADHPPKRIQLIENTKNADIIYLELNLPHPLHNRDLIQKRLFVGNKEDPELVKHLGLFDWKHEYYAIVVEGAHRFEYPPFFSIIRGETRMHYMLLEEDPKDSTVLKMRLVHSMDMGGDIPEPLMKVIRENVPYRMITSILNCYSKFFGKVQ